MPLTPGTKLGPYEISTALGAGGMGEVYRAQDTRLDRIVAIKVLPTHLSSNHELKQRFEREARAISSLAHPHICTLYDVGQQDGIDFLVMEFIEGESLAQRLEKGALPLEQTLRYATQIAAALDKAHRAGIVHRDLKPGNIMLTKAGAKLLDFGLAKLAGSRKSEVGTRNEEAETLIQSPQDDSPSPQDIPRSAFRVPPLTAAGTILGTFQYMAPEQLEGKAADQRTDIFALGAVIYEMATGRRAFTGKTQASLITAIMSSEPEPMAKLQPLTPPALERLVKKCLAKDADDRWQSAHDIADELQWIGESGAQAVANAATVTQPVTAIVASVSKRQWLAWGVAAALLLSTLVFAVAYFRRAPASAEAYRFSITPPEKTTIEHLCISPDGRTLAFTAVGEGKTRLYVRLLNSLTAQSLSGTEEAQLPFWSPDSHSLGFFAQGKLKRVDVDGKNLQSLCPVAIGRGGDWNQEGVILFAASGIDGVYRISSAGGTTTVVTKTDHSNAGFGHKFPHFLPDGRHFLYTDTSPQRGQSGIYLTSLDGGEPRRLVQSNSQGVYVAPGYLLYASEGGLVAQSFDARRQQLSGEPMRIAEQVMQDTIGAYGHFSASAQGTLIYDANLRNQKQLAWFDRGGKLQEVYGTVGAYIAPSLSPDGKRLAVQRRDAQSRISDLWIRDLLPGAENRFTFDPRSDLLPVWSPDGSQIVWSSNRGSAPSDSRGIANLYVKAANGGGQDELLFASNADKWATAWSADSKYIGFHQNDPLGLRDLFYLPLSDKEHPVTLLQTPADEFNLRFSPDSKWYAYTSNEFGNYEVCVQGFPPAAPAGGGKWQISTGGGSTQLWRRDGKELYFISADRKLMAVEVKAGASFAYGAPKALFDFPGEVGAGDLYNYTVSADGQKFLIVVDAEELSVKPIVVLQNWTELLKK